ncbi:MAG: DUF308 domain-containing protein [Pseudomonadota bacterium]
MKPWMKWLLLGILSIVFGLFVLSNTGFASLAVTTIVGALFVLMGAFQIIGGLADERTGSKVLGVVLGALMAFIGVSFMFNPLEGVFSLALLITILLAAGGIMRIGFARRMKGTQFYWPMMLSGGLSIALAVFILINFSTVGPDLLGILLGIELLFNGAGLVVEAFFLRTVKKAVAT